MVIGTVTAKGNRECRKCGGRLKDVTEPDEGVRVYECQSCGETYDEGQIVFELLLSMFLYNSDFMGS